MNKSSYFLTIGLVLLVGLALAQPTSVKAATQEQFMKQKVSWEVQPDACRYHIYYKEKGAQGNQFSARNIPAGYSKGVTWRDYTVMYLKQGREYSYDVKAYICGQRRERPVKIVVDKMMPM